MSRGIAKARRGSVSLMAALLLPAMVGMTGLGVEYGRGLMTQVVNQRVADLGAYSGAVAYNSTSSNATLTATVSRIATLNGLNGTDATAAVVTSPKGNGRQAVQVTVTTNLPLVLSSFLGAGSTLPVSATSYVELVPGGTPGCIIALSSLGSGVTLSGGTTLTANSCAVNSNTSVTTPNGTSITTPLVTYTTNVNGATPPANDANIHAPTGQASVTYTHVTTADPLSGNTVVSASNSHLTVVAAMTSPAAPSVTANTNDIFADYSHGSAQNVNGCSGVFSGSTWTFNCTGAGPYNFRNLTMGGGINLVFNTTATTTYNFSGQINIGGSTATFGPGTYNIAGGISTGGGTTTTFGAGTYNIGQNPSSGNNCSGGLASICHSGATLTFGGPSTFVLSAGIYVAGGETLTMGSGTTNSYQIGSSSTGNAIWLGGGAKLTMNDATGGSSLFKAVGTVNVSSGGGSCLVMPAAAAHDINGSFTSAGGSTFGAGVYSVNGYFALGANGGGDVTCGGSSVGLNGVGVTIAITGSTTPSSGSCSGQAFCVAAGFGHVSLTAPNTGTTNSLVVIGPTSSANTGGATFSEGATSTSLSGVFYFPYGPVSLGGGASVGNGTGQCLELIGTQVSLTGGTTLASTCSGLGGGTSGSSTVASVKLVK